MAALMLATAQRRYEVILPLEKQRWGDQLARPPWTRNEVKALLNGRYLSDEKALLNSLAREGSVACAIHRNLELTRSIIKMVFNDLNRNRKY